MSNHYDAVLLIGPDEDYLQMLGETSYKDLITLTPVEEYLRAQTHIEEADVRQMVQELIELERIDGLALVAQYDDEQQYLDTLPEAPDRLHELFSADEEDDDEESSTVIRVIAVGQDVLVPDVQRSFYHKQELEGIKLESGSIKLPMATGTKAVHSVGMVSDLDMALVQRDDRLLLIYTLDPEEVDTDLPFQVYLVK